jgi:hypothetical protein
MKIMEIFLSQLLFPSVAIFSAGPAQDTGRWAAADWKVRSWIGTGLQVSVFGDALSQSRRKGSCDRPVSKSASTGKTCAIQVQEKFGVFKKNPWIIKKNKALLQSMTLFSTFARVVASNSHWCHTPPLQLEHILALLQPLAPGKGEVICGSESKVCVCQKQQVFLKGLLQQCSLQQGEKVRWAISASNVLNKGGFLSFPVTSIRLNASLDTALQQWLVSITYILLLFHTSWFTI